MTRLDDVLISSGSILPDQNDDWTNYQLYNALDCAMTTEIFEEINKSLSGKSFHKKSYDFVRQMQAPSLYMSMKGIAIDPNTRHRLVNHFSTEAEKLLAILTRVLDALGFPSLPFNHKSPMQLSFLLYDFFALPPQTKWDSSKREKKLTTDREAIEKLKALAPSHLEGVFNLILRYNDCIKNLGTCSTQIDHDQRMRCSYNVVGTETGRWSSNANAFGSGTNLQNITNNLRQMFVADHGMKFAYIDGEQAESRVVAYLSGDENYISACENGDLHTAVTQMVWQELPWTDDPVENRRIADQKGYRHFSYRDLAKRLGHGTNYGGTPAAMAVFLKLEKSVVEDFQRRYFTAFPGIPRWHESTIRKIMIDKYLETPMGRVRYFYRNTSDSKTHKEAIAFVPQSTVGELLNLGLLEVFRKHQMQLGEVEVAAQIHDAILIQYPEHVDQRELLGRVAKTMEIPVPMPGGRTMIIPCGCEGVGWNWAKATPANPDGLLSIGKDLNDKRTRSNPFTTHIDLSSYSLSGVS